MKASYKKYLATKKGGWHSVNKPLMAKALKYTCQKCKKQFIEKRLQIHHFDYNYKSAVYDFSWQELYQNDIITLLCVSCHTWWHQNHEIDGNTEKIGSTTLYCFNCNHEANAMVYDVCPKCKKGKMQSIKYCDFDKKIITNDRTCRQCGISHYRAERMDIYFDFDEMLCKECITKNNEIKKLQK